MSTVSTKPAPWMAKAVGGLAKKVEENVPKVVTTAAAPKTPVGATTIK